MTVRRLTANQAELDSDFLVASALADAGEHLPFAVGWLFTREGSGLAQHLLGDGWAEQRLAVSHGADGALDLAAVGKLA